MSRRRHARPARGQATVELALALPFLALSALLVVQVAVVAVAQVRVEHAAREAGRAAAVDPDPEAAVTAAAGALGPGPGPFDVVVGEPSAAGTVAVVVRQRVVTDVPLVGRLVPDVSVTGRSAFRIEWDPGSRARRRPRFAAGWLRWASWCHDLDHPIGAPGQRRLAAPGRLRRLPRRHAGRGAE